MADGAGIIGQMGMRNLASWDAAWAAVNVYVPFISESLTKASERIQDDALEGYGGRNPSLEGNATVQGDTVHPWHYGADALITACMGTLAGTIVSVEDLLEDGTNPATWGLEFIKGGAANHRFWPAIMHKFTLAGEAGGLVNLTCSWAARKFEAVAAAAMTKPTYVNRVKFDQLVFRLGSQAAALVDGDRKRISSFEISFDRQMKLDDYSTIPSGGSGPREPMEPKENGFRVCTLKITLPRYDADTILAWREADTALHADMTFTGAGTAEKLIQLPELRITEGFNANVGGPEVITLEGTLEAYRGGSAFMYTGNEMRLTYTL